LSKRESRQLVVEILKFAEHIPTELRELVVRGAEGNPFYTEELIKMLIEDGVIIPDEETWGIDLTHFEEVDIPSTLVGVLQARLDSLPVHERTVLQQASVVGRLFWDRIVSHIQSEGGDGDDPQHIPQVLTSLRDRELIFRHEESAFVGAVEYLFKHDVLREVTYESVLKRLRKTYHGLVADWLIGNSGDRIGEYSGLIAEHLLLARREEQACEYFFHAGESALASFANAEAQHYFYLALELSPPETTHVELLSGLGEALRLQGKNEEAEQIFRQAIQIYNQLGNSDCMGDIYTRLSKSLWRIDYLRAWKVCQEGLDLLEGTTDSLGYARLLSEAGRTAYFSNVTDQVKPLCNRAVEMAQSVGDLEVQADATITMALAKEDHLESIDLMEEMIALTEENGLLYAASRAHHNLAYFLSEFMVNQESALQHELRAAEIDIQYGDIEGMLFALDQLYGYYIGLGKLKTVEDKMNEFLQKASVPTPRREKFFHENLPNLLFAKGEWLKALDAIRERCEELHQGKNIQVIEGANNLLISTIMELNRFRNYDDLSEIERALKENEELGTERFDILYGFGILNARQKRFNEAHDYILQAENEISDKGESPLIDLFRNIAEFELAFAEERWENAVAACKKSIELQKSSGYCWDCARRLIDLGDALVGRNEPSDLDRARQNYQQSLDMFTEMGAPGYIKVLEERLEV
jgi:tetratricopeptide (TPR) repeat protein